MTIKPHSLRTSLTPLETNDWNFKGRLEVAYAGQNSFLVYSKNFATLKEASEEIITYIVEGEFEPLKILEEALIGTHIEVETKKTMNITHYVLTKLRRKK